ncbi:phospholipid-transporting ATPase Dnf1p [Diutina rugosa]
MKSPFDDSFEFSRRTPRAPVESYTASEASDLDSVPPTPRIGSGHNRNSEFSFQPMSPPLGQVHQSAAPHASGVQFSASDPLASPPPTQQTPNKRQGSLRFKLPGSASSSSSSKTLNDHLHENGEQTPPKMSRHRWGTTRHRSGHPKKDGVGRSKTLKQLLNPNHHHSHEGKRKRSIRKPKTLDDSDDDHLPHDPVAADDPRDRKSEHRTVVFNRLLPEDDLDEDGMPATNYPRNKIRTTKYTPLTFLPKNIINQFLHNVANIYFLVLVILGAFDIFGVPSPVLAAVPLIVIVLITAVKDGVEDSRRTVTDMEINNQGTHILKQNSASSSNYNYINNNVNSDYVSPWRRFKKACSRGMFRMIYGAQARMTKKGREKRAEELRREAAEASEQRKSFESEYSPRASMEDPFADITYPSGQRRSMYRQQKTLKFGKSYWKEVKVGDVLRIYNNDEIPADVVILSTSDDDNCCYVETKNLDGETNLKVRQALKYGQLGDRKLAKADDLIDREFQIESEGPHPNLYSYQGNLRYWTSTGQENQEPVTINNLLLRGCSLRNTKWVIGIVVFTGDDTKIMLNAGVTPTKQSRMSRHLNYYVFLNFLLLFVMCFVSGLVNGIWYNRQNVSRPFYETRETIAGSPAANGVVSFFVALILYQSLVPISLYITIEIIKTCQAYFIYSDIGMYYARLDYPCTPKSWSISDDLGQIEYIFSDKTGTLTQNLMEFKKCTINGKSYGRAYTEALAGLRKRQGIDVEKEAAHERALIAEDRKAMIKLLNELTPSNAIYNDEITFVSSEFVEDLMGQSGPRQRECDAHFMLCLSLCHSVLVEPDEKHPGKQLLKAQSPDEAALVGTARSVGFNFKQSTKSGVIVDVQGVEREYVVLNTLEFNSTRKRMSAIVKLEEDGKDPRCLLITKGADSIIYSRLSATENDQEIIDQTSAHLEEFATEGLRTLCIAQRELSWDQYHAWNQKHREAASSLVDREEKMEAIADQIERELILLGGTAIEDRLQDGVPEAIQVLGEGKIKLWVLTGDKVETAINIGFSCNLLGNDMELLQIKTKYSNEEIELYGIQNYESLSDEQLVKQMINSFLERYFAIDPRQVDQLVEDSVGDHSSPSERFAIVIDGEALRIALEKPNAFLMLCKQCKSVLCCRVSPAQKAAVVKMVKQSLDAMTLAIGDGSNDVAMIQAADIGVGIAGEEGRQAVMSSDYAVGQFRYLARLLLVHGRWSYKRFSEMIPSFFYKNVIFTMALFWYGIYNDFDGSYLFEFTYLMFYNLAFTSLPVIFLGVFDQDVSAKVSLLVPQLYVSGIMQTEFTDRKFWWYMFDALYQSVISFFFPYLIYWISFINTEGRPTDHRFMIGIVVTCISCISCNLFILMHQYRWDWLSVLIVCISILIIFIWTGLWTINTNAGEFYKAAPRMFGNSSFWACMYIGVLICLMPRFFFDTLHQMYWPKDVDVIRECVQRGDFDAYPEDYDPTDPDRVKVSDYVNANTRRISMSEPRPSGDYEDQRQFSPSPTSPYAYNHPTESSVYTETIQLQEFEQNQRHAQRISMDHR